MAAEDRNDENLVVISGEEVARLFRAEFERVWSEAR
jgi:phosphatidylserine/phosphatidylglycerophosphate/cardiolipin synthase-like enzyme